MYSILKEAKYNCNIYTSPHIRKINERFIFNNKELNDEFRIVLTGGNAKYFKEAFGNIILVDEYFTSKALNFILGKF